MTSVGFASLLYNSTLPTFVECHPDALERSEILRVHWNRGTNHE
jgi:hypothetical protein